ncbi:MAG: saccharopine dehydrogenase NADP-binding domain-containing protein [Paracoccaceae bacterium]|jgi:saccharopine dehydrogenase-like NADP-dependent oxidoreductase
MWNICIIGAGKIGSTIATLLAASPHYKVTLADQHAEALQKAGAEGLATMQIAVDDPAALTPRLTGFDAVISAAPFFLTPVIAEAARNAGAHYFDLTEDVAGTARVRDLAQEAGTVLMPQCGLAPGFVGMVGAHLAAQFDTLETLSLRVGALPLYPTNALKYNLTWSTDGLINEYLNPCEALVGGQRVSLAPLEDLEGFALDGVDYECFNTSGGLGTLGETLEGKARRVSYRTIRYPGHRDILRLLLTGLGLERRRDLLKDIFEHALPRTDQDVVVVFCTATGMIDGALREVSFLNKSLSAEVAGKRWSAIQITTAAGVCGVLDMVRSGHLPGRGFIGQEQVDLAAFLKTEFGRYYLPGQVTPLPTPSPRPRSSHGTLQAAE